MVRSLFKACADFRIMFPGTSLALIYKQIFDFLGRLEGGTIHHGAILVVLLPGVPFSGVSQQHFVSKSMAVVAFLRVEFYPPSLGSQTFSLRAGYDIPTNPRLCPSPQYRFTRIPNHAVKIISILAHHQCILFFR